MLASKAESKEVRQERNQKPGKSRWCGGCDGPSEMPYCSCGAN